MSYWNKGNMININGSFEVNIQNEAAIEFSDFAYQVALIESAIYDIANKLANTSIDSEMGFLNESALNESVDDAIEKLRDLWQKLVALIKSVFTGLINKMTKEFRTQETWVKTNRAAILNATIDDDVKIITYKNIDNPKEIKFSAISDAASEMMFKVSNETVGTESHDKYDLSEDGIVAYFIYALKIPTKRKILLYNDIITYMVGEQVTQQLNKIDRNKLINNVTSADKVIKDINRLLSELIAECDQTEKKLTRMSTYRASSDVAAINKRISQNKVILNETTRIVKAIIIAYTAIVMQSYISLDAIIKYSERKKAPLHEGGIDYGAIRIIKADMDKNKKEQEELKDQLTKAETDSQKDEIKKKLKRLEEEMESYLDEIRAAR